MLLETSVSFDGERHFESQAAVTKWYKFKNHKLNGYILIC